MNAKTSSQENMSSNKRQIYQKVSAADFEREMTLVYLLVKGEFSKKKVSAEKDFLYAPS